MKKGYAGLAAFLMAVVLFLCQSAIIPVEAAGDFQGLTNLGWSDTGQGTFYNPNNSAYVIAYVYTSDGKEYPFDPGTSMESGNRSFDLYHLFNESGTYTFKLVIMTNDGVAWESEMSGGYEYTRPEVQLPVPEFTVTKEGVVTCSTAVYEASGYELGTDYGFNFLLYELNSSGEYKLVRQKGGNSSTLDFGSYMESGKSYYVKVGAISRDVNKYLDSEWSALTPLDPDAAKETEANPSYMGAAAAWSPSTSEELKCFAAWSTEEVVYTVDGGNAYDIVIQNSVQGEKCWVSFETVLGDYIIGRTYNIFPYGEPVYQMDSKARITLTVPESLQAENREFEMICVTENGQAIVLKDLDTDPKTVTFETNTYYAFALAYKDIAD